MAVGPIAQLIKVGFLSDKEYGGTGEMESGLSRTLAAKYEEMLVSENLIDKLVKLNVEIQPDKPAGKHPPSFKLFLHASGDWKVVLYKDSLWVVGHHLAYPARDRDDARRLLQELNQQYKRPKTGSEAVGQGKGH